MSCSACGRHLAGSSFTHPILSVPVCKTCYENYHSGTFTVENGNEIYCRWCGEGDGELLLCDSCPKSFCERCIERSFGKMEVLRIKNMSDRWNCLICSPQSFYDLCLKKNWIIKENLQSDSSKFKSTRGVIYADISRGREKYEIPVVNEVDNAKAPLDFVYVNSPISGGTVILNNNPELISCCSCTDGCQDPETCACLQKMGGIAYDNNGILLQDRVGGIYECNQHCSCHMSQCKNRVVGKGPHLRLEVFRCDNPAKGWGVRCKTNIMPGTYVADYIGEILLEAEAEKVGLVKCDEYLFSLDSWGRNQGKKRLEDLHMDQDLTMYDAKNAREMCISAVDRDEALKYLDPELVEMLVSKGAIERAHQMGKRLRDDPDQYLKELDRKFNIEVGDSKESAKDKKAKKNGLSSSSSSNGGSGSSISGSTSSSSNSSSSGSGGKAHQSWADHHLRARQKYWNQAKSLVTDKVVLEVEEKNETYIIDARWHGSVGRFFNHTCAPNLDVVPVFCESRDVRMPRTAFFANDFIPANTELCYDYGYYAGNVEGKSRTCLCGAEQCRKTLY